MADWPGTLVVVSHDTALLDLLDHTAERTVMMARPGEVHETG